MPHFPRLRIPKPWTKKRGKRQIGHSLGGIAGEALFYASLFLVGVFGISIVLIAWFVPERAPEVSSETLSSSLSFWVFGVLSIAAIATGAGGLLYRLSAISTSHEHRSVLLSRPPGIEIIGPGSDSESKLPSVPQGRSLTDSPGERLTYRLAMKTADEGGILGPSLLALLWSTVWFVLLAVVVAGFYYDRPRYILTFLLLPLGGIGYWSFRSFLGQLRRIAGVGSTIVEISDHPLIPGETYRVYVCQMGRLRLRRFKIVLSCEEESFYRQGTDVRVEKHEAFTQVICNTRDVAVDPQTPWEQQLGIDLPENVMHSFVGSHNAIRWKIIVSGESRPWPSFCRSFPVIVHPPGVPLNRSPR
ncbi:hypothetical protein [Novipirellula artificiosorum]|uniref:Uncharacterized protein n=1 Tax=Novipirellula artificiosorum TaxID=2528016 RepID=A0A5C6DAL7_9BACT|nr:hypothetical protein [Novipirellula artificiosorum]TWU34203.1 hypothetical protein Poly41_43490 [Novipirellula artificiosorum]